MNTTRQPRWDKWRLMPEVKVWEAVALSLNIEPEKINTNGSAWMGASHPFDEGDEFNDRLSVVVANASNRVYFPTACTLSLNGGYLCGVRLAEFAEFAVSYAKWDLPGELEALADVSQIKPSAVPFSIDKTGGDAEISDVLPENETPYQRRARLLQWREQEEATSQRGAHARTVRREQKINPSADSSNISKDIKKARQEREDAQRAGMAATTVAPLPSNPFGITKVIDGKRQN